jgi:hypothetical protein
MVMVMVLYYYGLLLVDVGDLEAWRGLLAVVVFVRFDVVVWVFGDFVD